jgi:hypothetical protein
VSNKIIDAKKINVLPKKTVAKKEEPKAEASAPEVAVDAPAEVAELVAEAEDNVVAEEPVAE